MDSWQTIVKLNTIDSTNNYFSNRLKESKFPEGTIISTLFQSSGKGIGSNKWESEKGKNILCSLVLYPDFLPVDKNFLLSKVISLGIVNYVQAKSNFIKIKWPNDIYYQNKKLAGILIENIIKGSNITQSIIGFGFNLNQKTFISDAPNPVSLNQITNKTYSIDQEIVKLRNNIRFFYDKLKAGKFEEINKEYIKCLYRYNEFHSYISNNEKINAKITGVNEFGHLQIITKTQGKKEFDFKEIEFVIP